MIAPAAGLQHPAGARAKLALLCRGACHNQAVPQAPLVSYILVNWHTEELLPQALDSIFSQTHRVREVFVVDNGSPGFHPGLLARYPGVELVRNPRNLGFAQANNQGLSLCQGEFVVLLNCDARLDAEFTRRALDVFTANPRIGTVVPKILLDDGSGVIDSAGHIMHFDRTPAHRGGGELDQGQYDAAGFVFGGTAAAIAYRREMLARIAAPAAGGAAEAMRPGDFPPLPGVFDESFFAYYEDVDLDWRAQLAGFSAYYEPECVAWHRRHGSGGRANPLIRLQAEKNRYLMLVKNDTLACQLASAGPLLLYEAWHALQVLAAPWLWPAALLFLRHLPAALRYRRCARRHRRVRPGMVAQWFMPRGPKPPPCPAPPSQSMVPLLERPGERSAARAAGELPLVSVVVLTYNGLELTKRCLESLMRQSYAPLELVLVDNGSAVDEAALLGLTMPGLKTLRLEQNHGFTGGVDWGLTLATGEYLALVNNDCILEPDCIKRLVYAQKRTGAPAVSGRLVDIATPGLAQAALAALDLEQEPGGEVVWDLAPELGAALCEAARNHGLSHSGYLVHDAYGRRDECFYPSGGLCLVKRSAVERLLPQLLPYRYFAYHEDVWLGFMLRAGGGWVAKEPRAAAVHLHSSTARRLGRVRLRYLQERNRWLNVLGFMPLWACRRLAPLWAAVALGTLLTGWTRPGDWLGWLAAQAWLWTHWPGVLRWRRSCRALATAPDESWLCELSGRLRGGGGLVNRLALWWCKVLRIPCREHAVAGQDRAGRGAA